MNAQPGMPGFPAKVAVHGMPKGPQLHMKETAFTPEGPQPLVREIAPGAAYPVASLGPLRDAVRAVQGATQAPVAIPAQSALAVASLAVQGFADVETLGGTSPLSLYALTIACDGDSPGRAAAHALAERASALGWQVDICDPGDGADFNDILTGKAVAA